MEGGKGGVYSAEWPVCVVSIGVSVGIGMCLVFMLRICEDAY